MRAPLAEQLHRTNQPDLYELFGRFDNCVDILCQMRDLLSVIATRTSQRDPLRQTFLLPASSTAPEPYQFSKKGYKHCRIRCPAAATGITVEEGGISVALTLPAGWSVLDAQEGARITATSAAATVTLEWTDEIVQ